MKAKIANLLSNSSNLKEVMSRDEQLLFACQTATEQLIKTIRAKGTIYSCGNGGSACDAMHFTEELIARFKRDRPGIKAMHMLDPGTLTCWSNDYEYNSLFERYVKTFCDSSDTLVVFSTSGNSENVLLACQAAKQLGTYSIGLSGKGGGKLSNECDLSIVVPSNETERVQEAHITLVHIFCEIIEETLFK